MLDLTTSIASESPLGIKSPTHDPQAEAHVCFPLALTAFEKYLIFDDRPDCPITSFIELHFTSSLQLPALQSSLKRVVHRHPLLASILSIQNSNYVWYYDPNFEPALRDPSVDPPLISADQFLAPSPKPFDLSAEPGCRYWYHNKPEGGSRLLIQLHHACCDGVGLRQVLIDILTDYAESVGPEKTPDEPSTKRRARRSDCDINRLVNRGDFSEIKAKPIAKPLSLTAKVRNAYYFHFQRPQPIVPKGKLGARPSEPSLLGEPLLHSILDEATSNEIIERCRVNCIAINDLALALLFQVCRRWNEQSGISSRATRLRLLMPFDLRCRSDFNLPATNRLSFAFLGRTHRECENWDALLASVQAETQSIKESRVYMDFLQGIEAIAGKPNLLRRLVNWSNNMSTTVLTYTGDVSRGMKSHFPEENGRRRIGDTYLENVLIAPPARRNTNVAFGLCINWGKICISANWNRTTMSTADCREFLNMYTTAWHKWLGS